MSKWTIARPIRVRMGLVQALQWATNVTAPTAMTAIIVSTTLMTASMSLVYMVDVRTVWAPSNASVNQHMKVCVSLSDSDDE